MSYIKLAELRKPPFAIPESALDEISAEFYLNVTKAAIDSACKQSFDKEENAEKTQNGKASETLYLRDRIVTLTEIRMINAIDDTGVVTNEDVYKALYFDVHPRYISWKRFVASGSSRAINSQGIFPKGVGNIVIKGTFGYDTVPYDIQYLQAKMIMKLVEQGTYATINKQEKIGDYSFAVRDIENAITGDPEFDQILETYQDFTMENA